MTEVHARHAAEHLPAHVAEQFEDADQQHESSTLGMWTFLATEILFFGALFVSYTIYRWRWPDAFRHGSIDLKWYLGAINTAVLLLSSFMMALAVHAASEGDNRRIVRWLILTIALAAVFLGIKGTEYYIEYREHLIPFINFSVEPRSDNSPKGVEADVRKVESAMPFAAHPETDRPEHEQLFMIFYFVMTAIHATHMLVGIGLMIWLILLARQNRFTSQWPNPVEMTGLYWHFVDVVWVFLFPVLYLLRNS